MQKLITPVRKQNQAGSQKIPPLWRKQMPTFSCDLNSSSYLDDRLVIRRTIRIALQRTLQDGVHYRKRAAQNIRTSWLFMYRKMDICKELYAMSKACKVLKNLFVEQLYRTAIVVDSRSTSIVSAIIGTFVVATQQSVLIAI